MLELEGKEMAYQKPKCKCGEDLYFVEIVASEVDYKINKNGSVSKRALSKRVHADVVTGDKLKCFECNDFYDWTLDNKGRIIISY